MPENQWLEQTSSVVPDWQYTGGSDDPFGGGGIDFDEFGNIVNTENETRWSMNCRFKSVFTPYGDKKLGEFFEPITLRAASKTGMEYKLPEVL